jgi:hypothetical protein
MNPDNLLILFVRCFNIIYLTTAFVLFQITKKKSLKLYSAAGASLSAFYFVYIFSGITFINGFSLSGEFTYVIMVSVLMFGLSFGSRLVTGNVTPNDKIKKNFIPVKKVFIYLTLASFFVYLVDLTDGNPFKIIFNATELKHKRLNLILVVKDFRLMLLESLFISMITIGLVWSIVGHKDNRRSDRILLLYVFLFLIQIISTGARSPLISFCVIFIFSLIHGKRHSKRMEYLFVSTVKFSPALVLVGLSYLAITTASRIEFEGLDRSVFEKYFSISDFGVSRPLFETSSGGLFLLGTILAYISSTVDNFIIKYQELDGVVPSFGYQFLFPYVSVLEIFFKNNVSLILDWKSLSSQNNKILVDVADSATQWSTVFGDFIWNFGKIIGGFVLMVVSIAFGNIAAKAESSLNIFLVIGSIYISANLAVGLVNPFGSLEFHIVLILLKSMSYFRWR